MSNIYVGCAIWGYRPWIGTWLPAKTSSSELLQAYSQRLTMVEINATFYAIPDAQTISRWLSETPATFRFCPKVPRSISHSGALQHTQAETKLFCERMRLFEDRLGGIFLQLPPHYGPERSADLAQWLEQWPRDLPLAVEVRHGGWYQAQATEQLDARLRSCGHSRVIIDSRAIYTGSAADPAVQSARRKKPHVPLLRRTTARWALIRFMGHPDLAIDQPLLEEWADWLIVQQAAGMTLYVAMHCPLEEQSPVMCYRLAEVLERRGGFAVLPTVHVPEQLSLL